MEQDKVMEYITCPNCRQMNMPKINKFCCLKCWREAQEKQKEIVT